MTMTSSSVPGQLSEQAPGQMSGQVSATVNALFAVGLELSAVRCLVGGEAGRRIDRAIRHLDDAISDVRCLLDEADAAPAAAPAGPSSTSRRVDTCADVCAFADPVWE